MEQASKVIGGDLRQFFNGNPFNTAIYSATSRTIAGWFSLPRCGTGAR
ncbi:Uncharacterised protein [Salmonella enterica subsp. enterica]|nr:Uncharacterised protein [Salmonella enterica subsp. enterica]